MSTRRFPPNNSSRAGFYPALFSTPLKAVLSALFFLYVFLFFAKIDVWDIDFWWHLSTGKYIVENMDIPGKDPFAFTSGLADPYDPAPQREPFILKMYWLAQALFYMAYKAAGFAGIKALRAGILTLTAYIIYLGFKRKGVSSPVIYPLMGLFFVAEWHYTGERPQLFSFFFTALSVFIIEEFRAGREKGIYFLPPVFLIWANMHGGFIFGLFVVVVYIFFEALKYKAGDKFSPLPKDSLKRLAVVGAAAVAVSFLNPNTYHVVPQTLVMEKYFGTVQEMLSPFHFYSQKIFPVDFHYPAMLFLAALSLIALGKRDLTASALLLCTAAFSIRSTRYMIFFFIVGMFFVAPEIERLARKITGALRGGPARALSLARRVYAFEWLLALFLFYSVIGRVAEGNILTDKANAVMTPVGAAEFIKRERIPGRMFNSYEFGGYLIWALYPEKQVFIDSRGLKIGACYDYDIVTNAVTEIEGSDFGLKPGEALWEKTLDLYKINFLAVPLTDYRGDIMPINLALLDSPGWTLVYSDHLASIFVRNTEINKKLIEKYAKQRDSLFNSIIVKASYSALKNKVNPLHLVTLGKIFEKADRPEDARKAYRFALDRDSENKEALEGLKRLNEKR